MTQVEVGDRLHAGIERNHDTLLGGTHKIDYTGFAHLGDKRVHVYITASHDMTHTQEPEELSPGNMYTFLGAVKPTEFSYGWLERNDETSVYARLLLMH